MRRFHLLIIAGIFAFQASCFEACPINTTVSWEVTDRQGESISDLCHPLFRRTFELTVNGEEETKFMTLGCYDRSMTFRDFSPYKATVLLKEGGITLGSGDTSTTSGWFSEQKMHMTIKLEDWSIITPSGSSSDAGADLSDI